MSNISALRGSCAAFAAFGALVGALATPISSATAQTTYETQERITVFAPHAQRHTIGRSTIGASIEEISLSHPVDYSDLDLSRWADVRVLDDRIRQTAYAVCDELDRQYPEVLYPSYQTNDLSCVGRATNEGRAQARLVIAQWSAYPPLGQ